MTSAVSAVQGGLSYREASSIYSVPIATLCRRVQCNKTNAEPKKCGQQPIFTKEEECILTERLLVLEASGFPLTPKDVRRAAFSYAEKLGKDHCFNNESRLAGIDWFKNFLKRNLTLSVRQAEGLSRARAEGMSKERVEAFYDLLFKTMQDLQLLDKPEKIFNVDETGFPLNNRPPRVIGRKGKREIHSLTNVERGENVTVVACGNAAGSVIPPLVIFKGTRSKPEFGDNMPPGTKVEMSDSGYIKDEIFLKWLDHFNQYRTLGNVLLLLDGHATHTKSLEALEYCIAHNITLICLPSHTTHALQPLDRSFFKPLKSYYHEFLNQWVHSHPGRPFSKLQFGLILNQTWGKVARVEVCAKGFQTCGIFPFNKHIIPYDKFYPSSVFHGNDCADKDGQRAVAQNCSETAHEDTEAHEPIPTGPIEKNLEVLSCDLWSSLKKIIPSPQKELPLRPRKPRKRQDCFMITSPENLAKVKKARSTRDDKENEDCNKRKCADSEKGKKKDCRVKLKNSTKSNTNVNENNCRLCGQSFYDPMSSKKKNWIRCEKCMSWYHEYCVGSDGKTSFICGICY